MKIPFGVIIVVLLVMALIRPGAYIFSLRGTIVERGFGATFSQFERLYYRSQYVQKKNPSIIPDQILEAFAGGAFLKGTNPILIVHDQPPLGRYVIALSIVLFDNPVTIPFIVYIAGAAGVFFLSKLVLKSWVLALVPFGIFINEPLFLTTLNNLPLLEPIQFPFIVWAVYFFIAGSYDTKHSFIRYVITGILLGFVISIRYFVLGGVLTGSFCLYLLWKHKLNNFKTFLFTLPISLMVLVLSYTRTIQLGYSIRQIFGIQKYIFLYHKSAFTNPFSFWDLLLFNRWHTWWGTYSVTFDPQWFIGWPVSFLLTLGALLIFRKKKISFSNEASVLFFWVLLYCLMLSVGYTSTRYFLPLVPFLYILATYAVSEIYKKKRLFPHK
jgi:hypothetical protein